MIRYAVKTGYGESGQIATFYHSNDIDDSMKLTNWNALTSLDIDKFILMDDGSELFAKITYVNGDYVRTTGGTFRIKDIIHCAIPKYEFNGYSGASSKTEHFLVRPPSKNEIAKVNQTLSGKKMTGRMTERVKMLLLERMQERIEDLQINEEFIVDNIVDGATTKDMNGRRDGKWLECIKLLAKLKGFDLEKPNGLDPSKQIDGGQVGGFNRFGGSMVTVTDRKKAKMDKISQKDINTSLAVSGAIKNDDEIDIYESEAVVYEEESNEL